MLIFIILSIITFRYVWIPRLRLQLWDHWWYQIVGQRVSGREWTKHSFSLFIYKVYLIEHLRVLKLDLVLKCISSSCVLVRQISSWRSYVLSTIYFDWFLFCRLISCSCWFGFKLRIDWIKHDWILRLFVYWCLCCLALGYKTLAHSFQLLAWNMFNLL